MSDPQTTAIVGGTTGVAGLSFPLWNEAVAWATGANQALIAVLGLAVLILTARKLWIDNKIANRRWRDMERDE